MVGLWTYSSVSFLAAGTVIGKYAWQYQQFYPTVTHIVNSSTCNLILGNFALALLLILATFVKWAFLESLRDIELANVQDRLWVTIIDTLLAITIFHEEFSYFFFFLFGSLLTSKVFHWLAADRVDYIASGASNGLLKHLRLSSLMTALLLWDLAALYYCGTKAMNSNPSVMILFAFEHCILSISMVGMIVKYILNCYDLSHEGQWESKGVIVMYLDFVVDIVQLLVYFMFFVSLFQHYGLPLTLVRPLWLTFQSFWKRVTMVARYVRATSNVDTRFPEASREQLEAADVCIICRDTLDSGRVLRCGHILHRRCLLSYLEHSQICPMCRESVFDDAPLANRNNQQQQQQHQQPQQQQQQQQPEHEDDEWYAWQMYQQQQQQHQQQHQQQYQQHPHGHFYPPPPYGDSHYYNRSPPYPPPPTTSTTTTNPSTTNSPTTTSTTTTSSATTTNTTTTPSSLEGAIREILVLQEQVFLLQEQVGYMQHQIQNAVGSLHEHLEAQQRRNSPRNTGDTISLADGE